MVRQNKEFPRYPQIWQCVGMIVGVYGVGYLVAASDPLRHWPIVLVGMRQGAYVQDVLTELKRSIEQKDRQSSWARLMHENREVVK